MMMNQQEPAATSTDHQPDEASVEAITINPSDTTKDSITICVKMMTGELISFECGIDDTLLDLKQKIQSIDASLSVGRQRLFDISRQMNEKCHVDISLMSNAETD